MARALTCLCLLFAVLVPLPLAGAEVGERPVPVVDLSVHLPYQLTARGRSLTQGSGQADAMRLRQGGVIGVVLPLIGSEPGERRMALEPAYLAVYRALAASHELRIPGCRRKGPGVRTWLALDGASELAATPTAAKLWAVRGVRLFGLVRDRDNDLATSSAVPPPVPTGLTPAGRELVRQIHAAGGVVDVAHASEATVRDVVELARQDGVPVVASHANARALADDPRNLSDSELGDIAATGGVVGVTFARRLIVRGRDAELADVVRQVKYLLRVAGPEHVAIGSGYEGGGQPPPALMNAARYPRLAEALATAGVPRDVLRKVMATNALRVLCPPTKTTRSSRPE